MWRPPAPPAVRLARPEDAAAVAAVHAEAWAASYAELLSAGRLAPAGGEGHALRWAARIAAGGAGAPSQVFVAERGGGVAGFAALHAQRAAGLRAQGWRLEVGALYVAPAAQGHGLGRLLMSAAAHRGLDLGEPRLSLWSLTLNAAARGFYEALGGKVIAVLADPRPDAALGQTAYGWEDATRLL